MRKTVLAAAIVVITTHALPVLALCRDDLPMLKARIDHEIDRKKQGAARELYNRAVKAQPGSEIDCHNDLVRAWRALRAPTPPDDTSKGGKAPLAVHTE